MKVFTNSLLLAAIAFIVVAQGLSQHDEGVTVPAIISLSTKGLVMPRIGLGI